MFARSDTYFRLHLLLIIITTTCISLSLHRTSAPIHLTSVLDVLGTQETFCIIIAGLLDRVSFDLLLPKFDKPWVIHLKETCCCSTNLCTWRPNTVYKNRHVRRHQWAPPRGSIVGRCGLLFLIRRCVLCWLLLLTVFYFPKKWCGKKIGSIWPPKGPWNFKKYAKIRKSTSRRQNKMKGDYLENLRMNGKQVQVLIKLSNN
jgi:hypothetical protein